MNKVTGYRCPICQHVHCEWIGNNEGYTPTSVSSIGVRPGYSFCTLCQNEVPDSMISYVEYDEDEQDLDVEMDSIFEEQ